MATRSITSTQLKVQLTGLVKNTLDDGTSTEASLGCNVSDRILSGIEDHQANRGWQMRGRVLNVGASLVIDLYSFAGIDVGAGTGNDIVGQAMLPIDEVVALIVKNEAAASSNAVLEIEPDGTGGWTPVGEHTVANGGMLRSGGVLVLYQPNAAGFEVASGISHRIKFTAVNNTLTFSVYLLGRHDADESSSSRSSSSSSSSSSSHSSSSFSSQSSSSSSSSSSRSSTSSSSLSSSQSTSSMSTSSSSVSTSSQSSQSSSSQSSRSSSSSSISTSTSSVSPSSESSSSPQSGP